VALGSRAPLLLTGPTGAGKTRLAQRIYELKKARHQVAGALVEVNCATLRGDQAMSALFGHVRGAFTGATAGRPGLLRAADGGVLFLDEIAELGGDEQAMLLRALEGRSSAHGLGQGGEERLPARRRHQPRPLRPGARGTLPRRPARAPGHLDLPVAGPGRAARGRRAQPRVRAGRVRPPAGTRLSFSKEARARFLAFATAPAAKWAGNFRDLNAAVTRMGTLAPGGRITVEVVAAEIARLSAAWNGAALPGALAAGLGEGLEDLDLFDQVQLAAVLQVCRSSASLSEAGRTLFARSRQARRAATTPTGCASTSRASATTGRAHAGSGANPSCSGVRRHGPLHRPARPPGGHERLGRRRLDPPARRGRRGAGAGVLRQAGGEPGRGRAAAHHDQPLRPRRRTAEIAGEVLGAPVEPVVELSSGTSPALVLRMLDKRADLPER
jgi:transcriptional regulatory protein RtcR